MYLDSFFSLFQSTTKCLFLLDVLYTQLVVTFCNILIWRGLWNILDTFFYPEDVLTSSIASLVVGLGTVIVLFLFAPLMAIASERLDSHHIAFKLTYEGLIFVIGTCCVLTAWRGGWDLCRDYVIPDPRVGGWVCHVVGVVGLILTQCFSSVALSGIDIDGTYNQGQGLFPTSYLRYYFEDTQIEVSHADIMPWKYFPHYRFLCGRIPCLPVDFQPQGPIKWSFYGFFVWISCSTNSQTAGDLRCYDHITFMSCQCNMHRELLIGDIFLTLSFQTL